MSSTDEFIRHVDSELRRVLPPKFSVRCARQGWTVNAPEGWHGCSAPELTYELMLEGEMLVVLHNNTDAGVFTLERALHRATVISASLGLTRHFGLSLGDCLLHVFESQPPNRYGLT